MVNFTQDEARKMKKLPKPWHGQYRMLFKNDPDMTFNEVSRSLFSEDQQDNNFTTSTNDNHSVQTNKKLNKENEETANGLNLIQHLNWNKKSV